MLGGCCAMTRGSDDSLSCCASNAGCKLKVLASVSLVLVALPWAEIHLKTASGVDPINSNNADSVVAFQGLRCMEVRFENLCLFCPPGCRSVCAPIVQTTIGLQSSR